MKLCILANDLIPLNHFVLLLPSEPTGAGQAE